MFENYFSKFIHLVERVIIVILMASMLFAVCYATYLLVDLMYTRIFTEHIGNELKQNPDELQKALYRMFGSMLTILLGMELIHTVKIYFEKNIVKIELILVISIIAISRHIIQLDYHHVEPLLLMSIAALLAVFLGGYLLMIKTPKQL